MWTTKLCHIGEGSDLLVVRREVEFPLGPRKSVSRSASLAVAKSFEGRTHRSRIGQACRKKSSIVAFGCVANGVTSIFI